MSDTNYSLFYNSQNGDRVYDADSFEHLLKRFFTSGVFSGSCVVTADGTGMTCSVSDGYANCDGKIRLFDEATELSFDNAHATYDRIDTVVVERNDIDREITCKIVKGTYSATPTPTAPVRANRVYQLVLAEVYIAAGATSVTQAVITDKRPDTSVCGYVMCAVQTPDFSDLYTQFLAQAADVIDDQEEALNTWKTEFEADAADWKEDFEDDSEDWKDDFEDTAEGWYTLKTAEFAAWLANLQDQLDDNQAGHLQNEIDDINTAFRRIGIEIVNGRFMISPVEYVDPIVSENEEEEGEGT